MPDDLPIMCSLDASDFKDRLNTLAELGRDALLEVERDGRTARLRFRAGVGVGERLERVVAAESACCAFLTMRVDRTGDDLVLTIEAPNDAELALDELVDAFRGQAPVT